MSHRRTWLARTLLASLSLSVLSACGPVPGTNPGPTASPGSSATASPTPIPTPGVVTSPSPTSGTGPTASPTPALTPNPNAGASTTVTLPDGSRLVLSLGNRFLSQKGETIGINAQLFDAQGAALPLSNLKLLFSSSRPGDLAVSDQGLITALVDDGFSTITVRVEGTSVSASQLISVSANSSGGGGGGGSPPRATPTPLEDLDVGIDFEGLGSGEIRVNSETSDFQDTSSVAMDALGNFVVTWQSEDQDGSDLGIYAQRYNSAGLPLGSEFRVNAFTTGAQSDPDIAMADNGDFVIVWSGVGPGGEGIYARRFNHVGSPRDIAEFEVSTSSWDDYDTPAVAMDTNGDFTVAWNTYDESSEDDGILGQRYQSNGAALGTELEVVRSGNELSSADIGLDDYGNFVVTWEDEGEDQVYARYYGSAGELAFTEFRVSWQPSFDQASPAVAMRNGGAFIVTWNSSGQDGSGEGIRAKAFNPGGVVAGVEFPVNTYVTGNQVDPAIAVADDGDYVITWTSEDQDGSQSSVQAQRMDFTGALQGNEYRVNTFTANAQLQSAVAMDSDGDMVITWESSGQDGNKYGVYAKRFNASGQAQ